MTAWPPPPEPTPTPPSAGPPSSGPPSPPAPRWHPAPVQPLVREPGQMSAAHRVLGVLYAVVLAGVSVVGGLVSVFAFAPTQCPSRSQQLLCDHPEWQSRGVGVLALVLATAVVVAIGSACVRTTRAGLVLQAASLGLVVVAVVFVAVVAG